MPVAMRDGSLYFFPKGPSRTSHATAEELNRKGRPNTRAGLKNEGCVPSLTLAIWLMPFWTRSNCCRSFPPVLAAQDADLDLAVGAGLDDVLEHHRQGMLVRCHLHGHAIREI